MNPSQSQSSVGRFLKTIDFQATPIGFTYNQSRVFKSSCSGLLSFITVGCILASFLYLASDIWNFKVTIKNTLMKRDLVFDNSTFDTTDFSFDFAVQLEYIGYNSSRFDRLYRFASVNVENSYFRWDNSFLYYELDVIEMLPCPQDAFQNDTKFTSQVEIVGNYLCPTSRNFLLQGSPASQESRAFMISVRECNQTRLDLYYPGEVCADIQEQQEVVTQLMIKYVFANSYFSGENQLEPIQKDYKMLSYGSPPKSSQYIQAKISINYAILKDSWLFESFQSKNISYSTLRIDYQTSLEYIPYNPVTPFISVMVYLDANINISERTRFNLIMALESIGGFASVCMLISNMFFLIVKQFIYFREMLTLFYHEEVEEIADNNGKVNYAKEESKDNILSGRRLQLDNSGREQKHGDNEKASLQEQLLERINSQFNLRKPLKINFWNYLLATCKKDRSHSIMLIQGRELLQKEFDLKNYMVKIRMLDFYLELMLKPFQRKLLEFMAQSKPLTGVKTNSQPSLNQTSSDPQSMSYKECLEKLFRSNQHSDNSKFNRNLSSYLGIYINSGSRQPARVKKQSLQPNALAPAKKQKIQKHSEQVGFKKLDDRSKFKHSIRQKIAPRNPMTSEDDSESQRLQEEADHRK